MRQAWLILALACAIACKQPAPTGAAVRVLMLTATAGFRHDAIATARDVLTGLAPSSGFTISVTEDLSRINAAGLSDVDVVMFALTSGELPFTPEQRAALIDAIAGGKGFIGIHSATDTLSEFPTTAAWSGRTSRNTRGPSRVGWSSRTDRIPLPAFATPSRSRKSSTRFKRTLADVRGC